MSGGIIAPPPSEALPTFPQLEEEKAKIGHFRHFLNIFFRGDSGAATGVNTCYKWK